MVRLCPGSESAGLRVTLGRTLDRVSMCLTSDLGKDGVMVLVPVLTALTELRSLDLSFNDLREDCAAACDLVMIQVAKRIRGIDFV